jgi:hypothetical protein
MKKKRISKKKTIDDALKALKDMRIGKDEKKTPTKKRTLHTHLNSPLNNYTKM